MEQAKMLRQNANVRILMVMCFFASSIGDAFNTVFIRRMLTDSGIVGEIYISIPITAMSAMMVLGVLISGRMVGKMKSFNSYLRCAIALLFVGLLLRGLAFDYYVLVGGFAVSGFGIGLLFIGVRYYAFMFSDKEQRTKALVNTIGGSFVGQCLGTILGGILAGQLDHRYIYLLSAALLLIPFIMATRISIEGKLEVVRYSELLRVLKNRKALIYLLSVVLPMYAFSIFISYTVPLDVNDYGYSSTVTSVLIFINYLLSAYAGLILIPKLTAKLSGSKIILMYLLLTTIMVILYVVFPSMIMLSVVVIVCGVLDSFGLTLAIDSFTATKSEKTYSDNSSLILFYLFSRIGQMIGPTMISATGNLAVLGAFLLIGAIVFLLSNGVKSEK